MEPHNLEEPLESFYCAALTGQSGYNISINSDLTVSCVCQDSYNEGVIGDMNKESFKEIFFGSKANEFRNMLAYGMMPTPYCKFCSELTKIDFKKALYFSENYSMPHKGIMIENNVSCNYRCTHCQGKVAQQLRKSQMISLDDMRRIADEISEMNLEYVYFFKLGEPFVDNEILAKLEVLIDKNPDIKLITSSNGSLIDTPQKIAAALLFERIFISIDGADDEIINMYQLGANLDFVLRNIEQIAKAKKANATPNPTIIWKYVVFSWNESPEYIQKAYRLACIAGCDQFLLSLGGTLREEEQSSLFLKDAIIPNTMENNVSSRTDSEIFFECK